MNVSLTEYVGKMIRSLKRFRKGVWSVRVVVAHRPSLRQIRSRTVQHLGLGSLGEQPDLGIVVHPATTTIKRASDHHPQGAPQAHRRKHGNGAAVIRRDDRLFISQIFKKATCTNANVMLMQTARRRD